MKPKLLILLTIMSCILGCEDQSTPVVDRAPAPEREVDPGELHNEIARAFAVKLERVSNEGSGFIPRKEFVKLMVEAANEVYSDHDMAATVSSRDINYTLNEFVNLRDRGVFDIYAWEPGDPKRIIDDWEQRGVISPADAVAVRARLAGDPGAYTLPASDRVRVMDSVWFASLDLWSDRNFVLKRPWQAVDFDVPPDKASLSHQIDSIFALFGMVFWGPSGFAVGGAVSSLIFEMAPAAPGESFECSDYCNMG